MEDTMTAVTEGFGLSQIGQITVVVHDVPRAVTFYRDVLGLRFLFEAPPGLAFFDCGGVRLMLSLPEGEVDYRAATIYYTVPDIQQATAVLGSRGVVFDQPPHVVARLPHADLWMAFFHDVDRNLLAIMSEVTRAV